MPYYHRFHWYATLENKTLAEAFPKFPSVLRVIDWSDRNPPITATSVTFRPSLAGCDWWILIRVVDNMYDWRKFWKSFRECFVFQSRVSTKTVVNTSIKFSFIASTLEVYRNDFDLVSKGLCIETDQKLVRFWKLFSQTVFQKLISLSVLINLLQVLAICTFFCICYVIEMILHCLNWFFYISVNLFTIFVKCLNLAKICDRVPLNTNHKGKVR